MSIERKHKFLIIAAILAAAAAIVAALMYFSSGEEPGGMPKGDAVVKRMSDKQYVALLERQRATEKQILKQLAAAKDRKNEAEAKLKAAKQSGASAEELARLEEAAAAATADVNAAAKNFDTNKKLSEKIIREKMWESSAAEQMKLQEKGK